jgi:hypothetical protein
VPLLAFAVVTAGAVLSVGGLVADHVSLGLVAGAAALVLAWLLYGVTVALLLRRRL